MTIKRGVSLYSYQNETFLGKMTLEDCIRTSVELGAPGIEVIGEQTFWGWPEAGVADPERILGRQRHRGGSGRVAVRRGCRRCAGWAGGGLCPE